MKLTLLIALTCVSFSSLAARITPRSSWAAIEASFQHNIIKPTEYNAVGGIFNACLDGDVIRSIKDVKYCAEGRQQEVRQGDNVFWEYVCERYESAPVQIARTTTKRECKEFRTEAEGNTICVRHELRTISIPVKFMLEVQEMRGETGYVTVFKKEMIVPDCQ